MRKKIIKYIFIQTTIGYGDFSPYTDIEKIYVIFMALFVTGLYGYAINKIG